MPAIKQSDRVREIVISRYVRPALEAGGSRLSIRARDVLRDAEATESFPRGRTPLICNVLQSQKLLRDAGLEIESVEGPPSRQSRTVVVHYRVAGPARIAVGSEPVSESPADRAHRLTEKLRGLLKDEIAAHGGAEGFIRWVRSDEDDEA
jgi:hypothetical protein